MSFGAVSRSCKARESRISDACPMYPSVPPPPPPPDISGSQQGAAGVTNSCPRHPRRIQPSTRVAAVASHLANLLAHGPGSPSPREPAVASHSNSRHEALQRAARSMAQSPPTARPPLQQPRNPAGLAGPKPRSYRAGLSYRRWRHVALLQCQPRHALAAAAKPKADRSAVVTPCRLARAGIAQPRQPMQR